MSTCHKKVGDANDIYILLKQSMIRNLSSGARSQYMQDFVGMIIRFFFVWYGNSSSLFPVP